MNRLPRAFRPRTTNIYSLRSVRNSKRYHGSPSHRQQPSLPGGDTPRYQTVRFVSPIFTRQKVGTYLLHAVSIYIAGRVIWNYIGLSVEISEEEVDGDEQAQAAGEDEEEGAYYAEEGSWFIPFTWATKLPRTYYRGSDPEWQEFVRIAKDTARHKRIQDELVAVVYAGSMQHRGIRRQLGKDPKVGLYWLEISFPDGPPQEYERSGIEIGDGFVAWSRQIIGPEENWRTMRALWPTAAFNSLWATGTVVLGIQYRRIKQALGIEDPNPFSPEERFRHALEIMQKQQGGVGKAQTDPDGNAGAVVSRSTTSSSQQRQSSGLTSDSTKANSGLLPIPMPPSLDFNQLTDLPIAMHVFSSTISKQWNPKKVEPPRGAFLVGGLVEVSGQRGRMLFDVQSSYDPRIGKFVAVNAGIRNFKPWNQPPKGGN